MNIELIMCIVLLGIAIVTAIVGIVVAVIRGDLKEFIEEKMIEAEQSGKTGKEKLAYVIEAVKEKYKLAELFINIKKFVEHIIDLSKKINSK